MKTNFESEGGRIQVQESLKLLIVEKTGIRLEDINEQSSFSDDLDIDSLDQIEIAMEAEKRFDIRLPDEEIERLRYFSDWVDFIFDRQKQYA